MSNTIPEDIIPVDTKVALNSAVYLLLQGFAEITAAGWVIQKIEVTTGSEITGHFITRSGSDDSIATLSVTKAFVYSEPTEAELQTLSEVV